MGDTSEVVQPATPATVSPEDVANQAINAQIASIPKILSAQQTYAPQFNQLQLEQMNKYAPQFAQTQLELQRTYAPQFAAIERQMMPELAGAQSTLANFLNQTDEGEYQSLRPGMLEDIRAGQSARGIGDISPLGSIDESVQLQRLRQSLKDRRLNVAMNVAGRVPISNFPQIQANAGVGQLVQNVDPNSIFSYANSLNNFKSQVYGTQAGLYGQQAQQGDWLGSTLSSITGGISGGLGAGIGSGIGTGIGGFFGGPVEAMAGAKIGSTVGGQIR